MRSRSLLCLIAIAALASCVSADVGAGWDPLVDAGKVFPLVRSFWRDHSAYYYDFGARTPYVNGLPGSTPLHILINDQTGAVVPNGNIAE